MKDFGRFLIILPTFFITVMEIVCLMHILINGLESFISNSNISVIVIMLLVNIVIKAMGTILYFIEE